ncbi:predicted protein [Lichtheimia corymbifera JMRC:FSU:9682]|uniref:Uncharacterized protein n=1 Tax=Lichtheimia corymbifera JMRC:FSU:9682 TaxID=1263082 RepID=A0A068SF43_9FUNG|nr:predicted protein [Lichtheimia corymbifera JMRC:FSU:9682]
MMVPIKQTTPTGTMTDAHIPITTTATANGTITAIDIKKAITTTPTTIRADLITTGKTTTTVIMVVTVIAPILNLNNPTLILHANVLEENEQLGKYARDENELSWQVSP